jgi:hypothetical protein
MAETWFFCGGRQLAPRSQENAMKVRTKIGVVGSCLLGCFVVATISAAGADDKTPAGGLTVIDNAGKEVKVKSWKFLAGTVHLSWLAKANPPKKDEPVKVPKGPEALEFRENKSTTYEEGIKTLIPISSIRKIDYDKKTVTVTVVKLGGKEEVLKGSTEFQRINKITLEAEADLGNLGVAAVKYLGGHLKDGIRGLHFADPAPAVAPPTGKPALVIAQDKEKHEVFDVQPLYKKANGSLHIVPTLYFKTKVKIDLAKIKKLRHIESENKKVQSYDFEVTLQDGAKHTLTLLKSNPDDVKSGTLLGLVGRSSVGYKLFPLPHTIQEVQMVSEGAIE